MIKIDAAKCVKCGVCVLVCKHGVFMQKEKGAQVEINPGIAEQCMECGHCIAACPKDAVLIDGANAAEFIELAGRPEFTYDTFQGLIRSRRSCRNYKKAEVPGELIAKIINSARYAPTAKNSQDVRVTVVTGDGVKKLAGLTFEFYADLFGMLENPLKKLFLRIAAGNAAVGTLEKNKEVFAIGLENWKNGIDYLFYDAPAVIVTHAPKDAPMPKDDCDYALFTMCLAAETLGLGTCINGFLSKAAERSKNIRDFLKIPGTDMVFNAMTIGYPLVKFRRTVARRAIEVNYVK